MFLHENLSRENNYSKRIWSSNYAKKSFTLGSWSFCKNCIFSFKSFHCFHKSFYKVDYHKTWGIILSYLLTIKWVSSYSCVHVASWWKRREREKKTKDCMDVLKREKKERKRGEKVFFLIWEKSKKERTKVWLFGGKFAMHGLLEN